MKRRLMRAFGAIAIAGGLLVSSACNAEDRDTLIEALEIAGTLTSPGQATQAYQAPESVYTPLATGQPTLEAAVESQLKVCSWNIEDFGRSKIMPEEADDEDVAEGIGKALAYIMTGCDVTAVQEISDSKGKVIPFFLEEYLNAIPPGNFAAELGPRLGRDASGEAQKEQYGFIYDSRKLSLIDTFTFDDGPDDGKDAFAREPTIAYFTSLSGNLDFVLVNIHTRPEDAEEEMLAMQDVVKQIWKKYPGEGDIIILGDTNLSHGFNEDVGSQWKIGNFYSVIGEDTTLAKSFSLYDQIVFDGNHTDEDFTGLSGVIRFGDYKFAVPDIDISDHYPVWAIFYTDKDTD